MNSFKSAIVIAFVLATTFSAQAIENNFTFEVYSSGPNIYACNAGLVHRDRNAGSGYVVGDNDTHSNNPGNYLQDAFYYKFAEVSEADWYGDSRFVTEGHKRSNGTKNYVLADTNLFRFSNSKALSLNAHRVGGYNGNPKVLSKLHFELSSENYGAEYFVDVCYYGARGRADHYRVGTYLSARAAATFTDISNHLSKDYKQLSGLKSKAKMVCRQGNSRTIEASTNYASVTGNLVRYWDDVKVNRVSNGEDSGPSKCVIRYSFKETKRKKLRVNIEHNMQIKLNTAITDPEFN